MAFCEGCGNERAYHIQIKFAKEGKTEICDRCGAAALPPCYDVYLGREGGIRREENLCDPKSGVPIPYSTKSEKAAIMNRLGIREVGDRVGGMRNETKRRSYFL
jgi:hypothetical protein